MNRHAPRAGCGCIAHGSSGVKWAALVNPKAKAMSATVRPPQLDEGRVLAGPGPQAVDHRDRVVAQGLHRAQQQAAVAGRLGNDVR